MGYYTNMGLCLGYWKAEHPKWSWEFWNFPFISATSFGITRDDHNPVPQSTSFSPALRNSIMLMSIQDGIQKAFSSLHFISIFCCINISYFSLFYKLSTACWCCIYHLFSSLLSSTGVQSLFLLPIYYIF